MGLNKTAKQLRKKTEKKTMQARRPIQAGSPLGQEGAHRSHDALATGRAVVELLGAHLAGDEMAAREEGDTALGQFHLPAGPAPLSLLQTLILLLQHPHLLLKLGPARRSQGVVDRSPLAGREDENLVGF